MAEEIKGIELVSMEQPITRSLGIERVYNLGDYKSIRFSDNISNLPDRVVFNSALVDKIVYLQLLNVELHYRQYLELAKKINTYGVERVAEAIQLLEDEKTATITDIKNILFEKE